MVRTSKATRVRSLGAAAVVAVALVAAGCGSSSTPGSTSSAAAGGGGGYGSSAASSTASAKSVSIKTAQRAGKTYLTDSAGRSVYLWTADSRDSSKCSGACASAWPPLVTKGQPTASSGARPAMLGTISRGNGTRQVTYDGHPLYYFAGDTGPGTTSGEGSNGFGAKWWLVAPAGSAVTTGSGAAPASSSSSSGGGW
ncbi:MAG TPA: hypothetical protein VFN87_07630 [Solirubrobacteraceae bacterium]|nr:hypothetical protein [Solirubrobacteraceae bacterium]